MYGNSISVPLRPTLSNQPRKVYPALVGSVGSEETGVAVVVVVCETTDPPFDS